MINKMQYRSVKRITSFYIEWRDRYIHWSMNGLKSEIILWYLMNALLQAPLHFHFVAVSMWKVRAFVFRRGQHVAGSALALYLSLSLANRCLSANIRAKSLCFIFFYKNLEESCWRFVVSRWRRDGKLFNASKSNKRFRMLAPEKKHK